MDRQAKEGVGATAFDLANSQNPIKRAPIMYGNQHVPKPTNASAKMTPRKEVMRQVIDAK